MTRQIGGHLHLTYLSPVDPVDVARAHGVGQASLGRSRHGMHAHLHQGVEPGRNAQQPGGPIGATRNLDAGDQLFDQDGAARAMRIVDQHLFHAGIEETLCCCIDLAGEQALHLGALIDALGLHGIVGVPWVPVIYPGHTLQIGEHVHGFDGFHVVLLNGIHGRQLARNCRL